jgi:hypothetical protein
MPSQPVGAADSVGSGLRAILRSRSRVARSARAIARWSGVAAGLALGLFHVALFRDRLVGGDLFDPAIALRWLAAVALVAALIVLRRQGLPLLRGRNASIVWLLVVLLHDSARALPVAPVDAASGTDASLIFVLPSTLAVVGLGIVCATIARRRVAALAAVGLVAGPEDFCRLSAGWRRGGTTRAPPLAAF